MRKVENLNSKVWWHCAETILKKNESSFYTVYCTVYLLIFLGILSHLWFSGLQVLGLAMGTEIAEIVFWFCGNDRSDGSEASKCFSTRHVMIFYPVRGCSVDVSSKNTRSFGTIFCTCCTVVHNVKGWTVIAAWPAWHRQPFWLVTNRHQLTSFIVSNKRCCFTTAST